MKEKIFMSDLRKEFVEQEDLYGNKIKKDPVKVKKDGNDISCDCTGKHFFVINTGRLKIKRCVNCGEVTALDV